MIDNLDQLKILLLLPSVAAGIFGFVFLQQLGRLSLNRICGTKNNKPSFSEDELFAEDEYLKYERIARAEMLRSTWLTNSAGVLCLLLFSVVFLFHKVIIETAGAELFFSCILILSICASVFIIQSKRWKSGTVDDLILYTLLFTRMAGNLHSGVRVMLFDSDTDFPMKRLLLEIQKNNPGISGKELVIMAGHILHSERLVSIFENEETDMPLTNSHDRFSSLEAFCSCCILFLFGIMLLLCFLL